MCGIMGYIHANNKADEHVIVEMQKLLRHRGPDDKGMEFVNIACKKNNVKNAAIGFVRLSIRDLSMSGHQPMHDDEGNCIITFNGEIYNADDFREELRQKGYRFKGHSDTEVLLYLYKEYGIDQMLQMLDGMYAICIADKRNDCLYLVRDRIGEKPLYYYQKEGFLMYASEYKAFYCHPEFKAELNLDAVDEYFLFRYVSGEQTLLEGVKNLNPGSYLKITKEGISETKYWEIPNKSPNDYTEEENKSMFRDLLNKGLKRRLISDRKVGLQLSGGVDSSYLAHLTASQINEPLQTYSITFKDKRYTEEQYIDKVNGEKNCDAHKYEFTPDRFLQCWKDCTWYFESPMNHEGTLGLLFLNRRAKEDGVSVMLCGEGADETLGGYSYFPRIANRLYHRNILYTGMKLIRECILRKSLPKHFWSKADTFISYTQYISDRVFKDIRNADARRINVVYDKRRAIFHKAPGTGIRQCMNYSTLTYLQDLLMRADKVSMASAMEVRVPFLMPELIEFECSIPDKYLVGCARREKGKMLQTKKLLKQLSSEIYGYDFTYRGKRGFSMPLLGYMQDANVIKFIEESLLPGIKRRGVLNYQVVNSMWNSRNSTGNYSFVENFFTLWCCLSFEMWAQMYIDNTPIGGYRPKPFDLKD